MEVRLCVRKLKGRQFLLRVTK